MSDSRGLDEGGYHRLSVAIIRQYARMHGYRFFFVRTPCLRKHPKLLDIPAPSTRRHGSCGFAPVGGDCNEAMSGSWDARKHGIETLAHCAARAKTCRYGNFASYSEKLKVCAWHTTCLLGRLKQEFGFQTEAIRERGHRRFDVEVYSACSHHTHGSRAPPWCKLPAINQTLMLHSSSSATANPTCQHVVFLDSDVYVAHLNRSLSALLDCAPHTLSVFKDAPWSEHETSSVMVWRNSGKHQRRARLLLDAW